MFEDQKVELLPARTTLKRWVPRKRCAPPPCVPVMELITTPCQPPNGLPPANGLLPL